ncbi:hypothetical protein FJ930_18340 [Mesorhizobium sp. B2-4-15]|nr:hypothetical protein FJ930_18340 [Mesorhizobium sp. B2-4-15]
MDPNKTTLERAFELARSGKCNNLPSLRQLLKSEGYDLRQLEGKALLNQLQALITAAAPPA